MPRPDTEHTGEGIRRLVIGGSLLVLGAAAVAGGVYLIKYAATLGKRFLLIDSNIFEAKNVGRMIDGQVNLPRFLKICKPIIMGGGVIVALAGLTAAGLGAYHLYSGIKD